jgi:hypothetical protein
MTADLSNPTDPAVLDALTRTCCICQVDPDNWCARPDGGPFIESARGQIVHDGRTALT